MFLHLFPIHCRELQSPAVSIQEVDRDLVWCGVRKRRLIKFSISFEKMGIVALPHRIDEHDENAVVDELHHERLANICKH